MFQIFEEKTYLVGVEIKGSENSFGIEESLKELAQLADTAGLMVVGSTYQKQVTLFIYLLMTYDTGSLLHRVLGDCIEMLLICYAD